MRPVSSLENFVCRSKCNQKVNQDFAKREVGEPKGKLSNLGPVLNKPLLLKRVTEGAESSAPGRFLQFCGKNCDFNAI